eukprot:3152004-Heterocapsa_arctica.AAC.1
MESLSSDERVAVNPSYFAEFDEEAGGGVTTSPSTFKMDGDDSDEDDAQAQSRQDAANELQHEYDQDF